jgi:hypothetical protein
MNKKNEERKNKSPDFLSFHPLLSYPFLFSPKKGKGRFPFLLFLSKSESQDSEPYTLL